MRWSRMSMFIAVSGLLFSIGYAATSLSQESHARRILNASPYAIAADEQLSEYVRVTAGAAYSENCASCHGADMTGKPGVPNLVDYDWLWGITGEETSDVNPIMAIQQTILYGVRNRDCPQEQMSYGACSDTRYSEMPGYGVAGFSEEQLNDLTEWVLERSGQDAEPAAVARAEPITSICAECHGGDSYGYVPYGGPNLRDNIWLYGDDRDTVYDVIANGRLGVCPPWANTLDAATIKALSVHIWNGG
jgi:cytochrome c oxidase cbb3-type subunit 3